jgi:hypothetical protein
MAQCHQFLGQPRQHQARIAHHREQHLAHGLGLTRVEPLGGRPVARESQAPQPLQCNGDVGRALADDSRGLLGGEAGTGDDRARQERMGELGALSEAPHDHGRLGGELQISRDLRPCALEGGTGARDGVAHPGRAQLAGFHFGERVASRPLPLSYLPVFSGGSGAQRPI